jgi:hypothetical protein
VISKSLPASCPAAVMKISSGSEMQPSTVNFKHGNVEICPHDIIVCLMDGGIPGKTKTVCQLAVVGDEAHDEER